MKRLLISILVLFCWFIEPIPAETYRVNNSPTNGVSQTPNMNMRSTSSHAGNTYSVYYSTNDKMQESCVQSYGSMNMNGNTTYCPGRAVLGITSDETSENIPSLDGPRNISPGGGTPVVDNKGHNWQPDGSGGYDCHNCWQHISAFDLKTGNFGECKNPCPLEFDWKVMVFMAVLAAGYVAVKRRKALASIHRGRP